MKRFRYYLSKTFDIFVVFYTLNPGYYCNLSNCTFLYGGL